MPGGRARGGALRCRVLKNEDEVNRTIDSILDDIKGTDAGATVPTELRQRIDGNINKLIELSSRQSSPLENAALFNSYTVAYSSPGPKQKGAPAGGRFRGRMGRLLFRTTGEFPLLRVRLRARACDCPRPPFGTRPP